MSIKIWRLSSSERLDLYAFTYTFILLKYLKISVHKDLKIILLDCQNIYE